MIAHALSHLVAALLRIYVILACIVVIGPYILLTKIAPDAAKVIDDAMDRHTDRVSEIIYALEY